MWTFGSPTPFCLACACRCLTTAASSSPPILPPLCFAVYRALWNESVVALKKLRPGMAMLDSHFVDEFQEVRACLRACVCLCVCLRVPACLRVCVCVCPARPCPATDRRIPPPPHLCVRVTGGATAAGAAPPQRRAVLWRRHVPGRQPVPRTLPTLHLSTSQDVVNLHPISQSHRLNPGKIRLARAAHTRCTVG